jgi:hypothetical protein
MKRATKIANDCTRCLVRNDGAFGTYCFHAAFAQTHPGDGRPIPLYPKTPRWCPGMVRKPPQEEASGQEPGRLNGR